MREFYRLVNGHKNVAIALEREDDDVKIIEKWPIIKAYAIDGIAGGFFTLLHNVKNVTRMLNSKIYTFMDKFSKLHLMEIHAKKLCNNMKLAVMQVSEKEQKRKCKELNQSEISELFAETFDMAEMGRSTKIGMTLPLPGITFGVHTKEKLIYKEKPKPKPVIGKQIIDDSPAVTPQPAFIMDSGHVEGKNALHCVMENVEAIGMNRCARTYFLTSNALRVQKIIPVENFAGYVTSYDLSVEKDTMFLDEYKLTSCYLKALQTYLRLTKNLRVNLKKATIEKAKEAILNRIKGLNAKLNKKHKGETNEEIEISIKCYDLFGKELDFYENEEINLNKYLVVLRVEVSNIQSVVNPAELIGSLVISDTFLFSDIFVHNLTQEVPYFDFFEARADYSQPIRDMVELNSTSIFGERFVKLTEGMSVYLPFIEGLDTNIIDFPIFDVQVSWFENTLKFHSEKAGCFLLMNSDMKKVEFFRLSTGKPWAIFHLEENIFFPRLTMPMICIRFSGDSLSDIYVKLKPHLDKLKIPTSDITELPDYVRRSLNLKELGYVAEEEFVASKEEGRKTLIEDQDAFLGIMDFTQSTKILSKGECKVKGSEIMTVLADDLTAQIEYELEFDENMVDVMVLIGPLGASKRGFIESVYELRERFPISEDASLNYLTYSEENLMEMTTDDFIQSLDDSVGDGEEQIPPGKGLVLMAIPHTCDHLKIIKHIDNSPKLRLRSVFSKLNLFDLSTRNQQFIENLAYFFEPGFNYFCFLDTENVDKGLVHSKVSMFKEAFPYVTFRTIEANEITYSKFIDVVKSKVYLSDTSKLLRSINRYDYEFGYSLLYLNYRIPVRRDLLDNLKQLIHEHEGALLVPEKKEGEQERA